jgi:3-phenylpropionate/cinnamic acid dioxygenase small subunit
MTMNLDSRAQLYFECVDFLHLEAELLDDNRFGAWLELLADDLDYRVPTRTTRGRGEGDFSDASFHMLETRGALKVRVNRLATQHAWAEEPPSRTQRLVTNARVRDVRDDEVDVKNNLLLYRAQGDGGDYDLLCGERHDTLRRVGDGWQLARRTVLLAQTTLDTPNLGVFL